MTAQSLSREAAPAAPAQPGAEHHARAAARVRRRCQAASLSIPDTRLKHLPALLGPIAAAAYSTHDRVVPNGKARRTARGFRNRTQELARLKAEYGVAHELVDDAPG